ncbi:hypothetical protein KKB28_08865, partial [bacterium]|nr:hypothetical protein [bacterium]
KIRFASGANSVVCDLRTPSLSGFVKSKIRHQSTAREYPRTWLMFFWIVLAAQIGYLVGGIWTFFQPGLWPLLVGIVALRFTFDYLPLWCFTSSYRITEWKKGFALAEFILPLYLLMQPIFALGTSFEWKQRRLTVRTTEQTKIP